MDKKTVNIIGALLLILFASGVVYISFNDTARMRVDNDKTTFYIKQLDETGTPYGRWLVSGREYNRLFDGNTLQYRDKSESSVITNVDNISETVTIIRNTKYKNGASIVDTYEFDGKLDDVALFPVSHTVEVINGSGLFYRYTVDDLKDTGVKRKLVDEYNLEFGMRMHVTLEQDYRWAWIGYPYGSDSLSAQYDVDSDYEVFNVRLFDPVLTADAYILPTTAYTNDSVYFYCNSSGTSDSTVSLSWSVTKNSAPLYSALTWQSNSSVVSGLTTGSTRSQPETFNMSGNLNLISGDSAGTFRGFTWDGSTWNSNTSLVTGLVDVGSASSPTVYYKDSVWNLISGNSGGTFVGYSWNGTSWNSNTSLVTGLTDVGSNSYPSVFEKDSVWSMVVGDDSGRYNGFSWDGSQWQTNTTLKTGLVDRGSQSALTIFYKDSEWRLINGDYNGNFYGYTWSGTSWSADTALTAGLSDIGYRSSPDVFEFDGMWSLLAGENSGGFYGFSEISRMVASNTSILVKTGDSSDYVKNDVLEVSCTFIDSLNTSVDTANITISNSLPVKDTVAIINDSNLLYGNTKFTDLDSDFILYNYLWYKNNVSIDYNQINLPIDWTSYSTLVTGLTTTDTQLTPDVFYKDSAWNIISGADGGIFYGFTWDGTTWNTNASLINGLSTIGQDSHPDVFYKDGQWSLIAGETAGVFYGFDWNGTSWNENTSLVTGLGDIGSRAQPSVFEKDGNWNVIAGNFDGFLYGFTWNGSQWNSNTTLVNGTGDIGYRASPEVFERDSVFNMIVGENFGPYYGFTWNGTSWNSNTSLVSGLYTGTTKPSIAVFEKDNTWSAITGEMNFKGYAVVYTQDVSYNLSYIDTSTYIPGDEVIFSVKATDNGDVASWYNSSIYEIPNIPPNNPTVYISPDSPRANNDLLGYCNGSDSDPSAQLDYYYEWYNDTVLYSSGSTGLQAQGLTLVDTIDSSNTSYGENWTFSCLVNDGEFNSSWVNSTDAFIDYELPVILYVSPVNNSANSTNNMYLNVSVDTKGLSINMTFLDVDNATLATFNGISNATNYVYNWLIDWDTNYKWSVNLSHEYGNVLFNYNFSTYTVLEAENTHLETKTDTTLDYEWTYNDPTGFEYCNIFVNEDGVEIQQLYATDVNDPSILVEDLTANTEYDTEIRCCARYSGVLSCISKYETAKTDGWVTDYLSLVDKKLITVPFEYVNDTHGADVTNYTLSITLNATDINFSHLQSDVDDIRFTDYEEINTFDYNVSGYDYSGNLLNVTILLPDADSTYDTKLFMYYNDATAINNESDATGWNGTLTNYTIGAELSLADYVNPTISGLTITDLTSSSARIYWNSSVLTDNWVAYSTNPFLFDSVISDYDNQTLAPNISITGLSNNQKYWIKVVSSVGGLVEGTETSNFTLGTYTPIDISFINYTEDRVNKVSTVCYNVTDLKGDTGVDVLAGYWFNDNTSFSYTAAQTTSVTGEFCFDIDFDYGTVLHVAGIANGTVASYTSEYVNTIFEPVSLFIGNPTDDFENDRSRDWEGFREGAYQIEDYAWVETNITANNPKIKVWHGSDYDDSKSTGWTETALTCNAAICYTELTGLTDDWYTFELWDDSSLLVNKTKPSLQHRITENRTDMYAYNSFARSEGSLDYTLLYFHDLIYNMSAKEHCLYYPNGTLKTGDAASTCSYVTFWGDENKEYPDVPLEVYGTPEDRGMTFRGQVTDASLTDSGVMKEVPFSETEGKTYGLRYCHSFIINYWDKPIAFTGTKYITDYYIHAWKDDTYRTKPLPATPYNTYIERVDIAMWNETDGNAYAGSLAWNQLANTEVQYPTGFYEKWNYKGTDVCPEDTHDNVTCSPVGANFSFVGSVDTVTSSQSYFDFPDFYIHDPDQNIDATPIRLWGTKKVLDTPIAVTDANIYDFGIYLDTIAYQRRPQIIFGTYHQSFVIFNMPEDIVLQGMDSDSDGLTDYEEIYTYNTNPKWDDTDNDGFIDGYEVVESSDPNLHYIRPAPNATLTISDYNVTSTESSTITCNVYTQYDTYNLTIFNDTDVIYNSLVANSSYVFEGIDYETGTYNVSCVVANIYDNATTLTDSFFSNNSIADTNFTIWNGAGWVDAYSIYMDFRCEPTQTECEPDNQNSGSSQSIYRVCNNGTKVGTGVVFNMNNTVSDITLKCDDDYTYAGAITVNTVNQSIHGELAKDVCIDISCWADYNNPSAGGYFDTYAYVTVT